MTARYIVGDCLDVLASLEPASVDLVMSSPPFLALRSYLPADHVDKSKEIGSEATPGEFIDTMLDVVEACARVLAPHGSLVFELGDTYAGSGGAGGDYTEGGLRDGAPGFTGSAHKANTVRYTYGEKDGGRVDGGPSALQIRNGGGRGWPLDKSKVLIPQLFAISLAYGFNPLTGRTTDPWRVRNTVAWCRPNPPVGRDGDKFRPATSFLTVATKARDRYWDGDAVRVPVKHPDATNVRPVTDRVNAGDHRGDGSTYHGSESAGAPLLDWWEIPTAPYKGSHYATYPPALVVPIVKAMCPEKVCRVCGKPSTRITRPTEEYEAAKLPPDDPWRSGKAPQSVGQSSIKLGGTTAQYETLGFTDCGHDSYRAGHVLDPFGGSGTTAAVATGHGYDCTLIDLDERNAELAYQRVGMFLTVEHFVKENVA